jgi:hypothetical protein
MKSKITSVLALLTIASVLAISGCTLLPSGGTTGGGPGIAIERFEPSLSTVRSNEQVSLRLEVRNNGDYTNAPAAAELMGIDPAKWNLYGNTMQYLGTLLAPDAASNTPGGRGTASWTLVSPPLVRGQSLTYRPIARVYYQYETRAIKPVTFVTANELKDIQRGGGSLTSEPTTYTNGPLSVQVTTGNFVQAPEIGAGEYKFQVQFNIENIGQGKIYGVNNPIAVQIEYPQFVVPLGECPRSDRVGSLCDCSPGIEFSTRNLRGNVGRKKR